MKAFRVRNINRIIIVDINVNSIRNKIYLLSEGVRGNIDILMVLETKMDDTFLTSKFIISGFSTSFTFDRTDKVRGILEYIAEKVTFKLLKTLGIYDHTECLTIEINLRQKDFFYAHILL